MIKDFFFKIRMTFFAALFLLGGMSLTRGGAAEEARRLSFYEIHTHERISVVYKKNGFYQKEAINKLNYFLRDWRTGASIAMDPYLFDVLWKLLNVLGTKETIHVISGYRSPETNMTLRKNSRGVAKKSHHMRGDAIDFYLPNLPTARVRAAAMRLQEGGVGYYERSDFSFVHMDLGRVRAWPRMSRKELQALFPRGDAAHLPADGPPLAHYAETKAHLARKRRERRASAPIFQ